MAITLSPLLFDDEDRYTLAKPTQPSKERNLNNCRTASLTPTVALNTRGKIKNGAGSGT